MSNRKAIEMAVGVFVAIGIGAIAMLAFKVSNLTSAEVANPYRVRAQFDNIGGLKAKSPVTMAGVRIGRVSNISFDGERYVAVVTLDIDGRYNTIPKDSNASILTQGLLGEQYIGLEPGGDEQYLKAGDTIEMTQSALVLERLIGQMLFNKAAEPDANAKPSAPPKR